MAPTIAPPTAAGLARGLLGVMVPGAVTGRLEQEVRGLFPGAALVVTACSGRAALHLALTAAMRATGRNRVVLPAWTSFSVAAAAAAAGARVDLCDVDPHTLGLDRKSLAGAVSNETAAVVIGNGYGLPDATGDLGWLERTGALLIDDAAQALGASERGRPAGSRGAMGVLSFGRGKCVTLGDGGALLVNDSSLLKYVDSSLPGPQRRGAREWCMAAAMRACAAPLAFGVASRLPGVGVGESSYDPSFERTTAPASVEGLAWDLGASVQRQLAVRRRAAAWWREALAHIPSLWLPVVPPESAPAWLRMPVLVPGRTARELIASRLGSVGLTFVRSYPHALSGLSQFAREVASGAATPGADTVADCLLALPCHMAVKPGDVRRAAGVISNGLQEAAGEAPSLLTVKTTRGD